VCSRIDTGDWGKEQMSEVRGQKDGWMNGSSNEQRAESKKQRAGEMGQDGPKY